MKIDPIEEWPSYERIKSWDTEKQLEYWKNMVAGLLLIVDYSDIEIDGEVKVYLDYLRNLLEKETS
jgi:hypothetical protein